MLVLAVDRLDFNVMFSVWLPAFQITVEKISENLERKDLLKLKILERIYAVCSMDTNLNLIKTIPLLSSEELQNLFTKDHD